MLVLAAPAARPGSTQISILYQGNLNGEIEPCGCPTVPKGGVARKATRVADLRKKQHVILVDAGDMLFPDEAIDPAQAEQRRIKADLILGSNAVMKVDALGLGDQDLAYGVSFLKEMQKKHGSPFLSANLLDKSTGKPVFTPHKTVEVAGAVFGLFSVMGPNDWRGEPLELGQQWRIADPKATAQAQVAALQALGVDYIIALTSQGMEADRALANEVKGIDVIIGSSENKTTMEPVHIRRTMIVHGGTGGEDLGQLEFTLRGNVKQELRKAVDVTAEFDVFAVDTKKPSRSEVFNDVVPLNPDLTDHPDVAKRVLQAKKDIASLGTEIAPAKLTGPFIGAAACQGCHPNEYEDWTGTPHARAYQTLVEFQRQFDYDCVGCHTTAFKQTGGFENPWAVGTLKNVQCEMCHGSGQAHARAPKKNKLTKLPAADRCRQCHSQEQTGDRFEFDAYIPKVSHKAR